MSKYRICSYIYPSQLSFNPSFSRLFCAFLGLRVSFFRAHCAFAFFVCCVRSPRCCFAILVCFYTAPCILVCHAAHARSLILVARCCCYARTLRLHILRLRLRLRFPFVYFCSFFCVRLFWLRCFAFHFSFITIRLPAFIFTFIFVCFFSRSRSFVLYRCVGLRFFYAVAFHFYLSYSSIHGLVWFSSV